MRTFNRKPHGFGEWVIALLIVLFSLALPFTFWAGGITLTIWLGVTILRALGVAI